MDERDVKTTGFLCAGCGMVEQTTDSEYPRGWLASDTALPFATRYVVCSSACGDRLLDKLTTAEVDRHHERMGRLGAMHFIDPKMADSNADQRRRAVTVNLEAARAGAEGR